MKIQRKNIWKIALLFSAFATVLLTYNFSSKPAFATSQSPPARYLTGAPALGAKPPESDCTDCHGSFTLNSGPGKVEFLDLPSSYEPGQTYTIRVAVSQASISKFGFELTVLDSTGAKAGTLATLNAFTSLATGTNTSFNGRQYLSHSSNGTSQTAANRSEWSFQWTAPATRIGKIGFYAAGVAANNNFSDNGDYVYTKSAVITPSIATVSSADYIATNPVPAGGAASAYGVDLANTTATAVGAPVTTLGGTTVKVKDALGTTRDALIFFVSPAQVNYHIADATATGTATVTITSGTGAVSTGTFTVAAVQPGVFTLTGDGAGLPVAQLQRVNIQTNAQTFEDTFVPNGATFNSKPIVFKAGERLFLVIYTNGVRNRSGLSAVSANIGGTPIAVQYCGSHGFFTGVDQVNVELPTNLGSGNKTLTLTVDGKTSNSTTLNFQ